MGMAPTVGAAMGSMIGFRAGGIVGEGIGATQATMIVVRGESGGIAVLAGGRRAGRVAGEVVGSVGGSTTGAAMGVIFDYYYPYD